MRRWNSVRPLLPWVLLLVLLGGANGVLFYLSHTLQGDQETLATRLSVSQDQIQDCLQTFDTKNQHRRLQEQAAAAGYRCRKAPLGGAALQEALLAVAEQYHLLDGRLLPGAVKKTPLYRRYSYTLYSRAALDTDLYAFIENLSNLLETFVSFRFVSLFRENDTTLTSEMQFALYFPHCESDGEGEGEGEGEAEDKGKDMGGLRGPGGGSTAPSPASHPPSSSPKQTLSKDRLP